ncbi:MAG: DUF3105 domain-containing protein [Candidatus Limnocylindrales bacterium]
MSKESRRRQRMAGQAPTGAPAKPGSGAAADDDRAGTDRSTDTRSSGPRGTDRVGRRERARATVKPSFIERYRSWLVGAAVLAVVVVVGAGLFSAATQPAYACSVEWSPEPTSTPPAGSSPQPGYAQSDMGHTHVATGSQVTFTYCPPASGRHYNVSPGVPIPARPYGPGDGVIPQAWVHNLEHGGLVILYKGDTADQTALRAAYDAVGPSPVCGFPPGGQSPGPVVARFDDMLWPYAAMVWGRVLPLETVDIPAILEFYAAYGEKTNPEPFCERSPSPSVPASESPAPSGSAAPSGSVAPSGSPAASESPSAAPSAAPSASPS